MQGTLLKYGPKGHQTCFISGPSNGVKRAVVWLGGLTDGLLGCSYLPPLGTTLSAQGIALVQCQLGSSYRQFGFSSLRNDAEDIVQLLETLKPNFEKVVLMGHSTGCQDIAFLIKMLVNRHAATSGSSSSVAGGECPTIQDLNIAGAILQAPVSDREYGQFVKLHSQGGSRILLLSSLS